MKNSILFATLDFLRKLEMNNNKDWMDAHREQYRSSEKQLKAFLQEVMKGLNETDRIENMKVFRINRDIRFSKDKTPYNTHRSVQYKREGARRRGGYYFRLQPGNSAMAGGFFKPEPDDLLRIRKEFELDSGPIRQILNEKSFKTAFGGFNQEYRVKTCPQGFDRNHPDIDLIRLKSFFVVHAYSDEQVLDPGFGEIVLGHFRMLRHYFDYMSELLTTDLNGASILTED